MSFHNNKIKFEVEVPTSGLPNMVQNPNGVLGGWGWETPYASTSIGSASIGSGNTTLTLQVVSGATAVRAQTESLPVVAGQYVGARFDSVQSSAGYQTRVFFAYYDANKNLLSTGPVLGYIATNTAATTYVPVAQTPTNTAYVRLVMDFYANTNAGVPTSGAYWYFRQVMVTKAATSAAIGDSRTNIASNPSFETDLSGFIGSGHSRSNTYAYDGSWSMLMNGNASVLGGTISTPAIVPGQPYTASFYVRGSGTYPVFTMNYQTGSGSADVSFRTNDPGYALDSTWRRVSLTSTAPTNSNGKATFNIQQGSGTVSYIDAILIEAGAVLNPFYSGTYANASYAFANPYERQNILSPTSYIETSQSQLDLGTLSATIYSTTLDPSISPVLRPGKRVWLSVLNSGGTYTNLWSGRINKASVNLAKTLGGQLGDKAVNISIEAVDNAAVLANQAERRGVETVPQLRYLLEGKSVPWLIDGASNQIEVDPTVVTINDNASVLDQVSVTRDSKFGYAWFNADGVLRALSPSNVSNTVMATFSDVAGSALSYCEDIDVSWNSEDVINSVTVKWLRYNSGTAKTDEISYPIGGGSYTNPSSIDQWGPYSKDFTLQGPASSESAANIKAFADQILAKNSTPMVRVNSLRMPVKNQTQMNTAMTLNQYDLINVKYADRVNNNLRVTSIKHSITPDTWDVEYDFAISGGSAAPVNTPSPTGAAASVNNFGAIAFAQQGGWGSSDPPNATSGTAITVPASGILSGMISMSGYMNTVGSGAYNIYLDGSLIGQVYHYFNQTGVHLVMQPCVFGVQVTAGTHYLWVKSVFTASDGNDNLRFHGVILPN